RACSTCRFGWRMIRDNRLTPAYHGHQIGLGMLGLGFWVPPHQGWRGAIPPCQGGIGDWGGWPDAVPGMNPGANQMATLRDVSDRGAAPP
ncbi:hypothetical protein KQI52_14325, partial [bacterium]|nr:hypothetical protein [bacterium]